MSDINMSVSGSEAPQNGKDNAEVSTADQPPTVEDDGSQWVGKKEHNVLTVWGNKQTMNLNHLVLENILQSPYYKNKLSGMKIFHELVDEIYYNVQHLEPWEKGTRKTTGQTGMCGGVRGVGAGGVVSTPFCIMYRLFMMKLTRKQVYSLLNHTDSPFIRGVGFMYIRFCLTPATFWDWYAPYLEDDEPIDPKAGGGDPMTIGQMVKIFLTKLEWYCTLFPRIPVPVQKEIDVKMREHSKKIYETLASEEKEEAFDAEKEQKDRKRDSVSKGRSKSRDRRHRSRSTSHRSGRKLDERRRSRDRQEKRRDHRDDERRDKRPRLRSRSPTRDEKHRRRSRSPRGDAGGKRSPRDDKHSSSSRRHQSRDHADQAKSSHDEKSLGRGEKKRQSPSKEREQRRRDKKRSRSKSRERHRHHHHHKSHHRKNKTEKRRSSRDKSPKFESDIRQKEVAANEIEQAESRPLDEQKSQVSNIEQSSKAKLGADLNDCVDVAGNSVIGSNQTEATTISSQNPLANGDQTTSIGEKEEGEVVDDSRCSE